MVRFAAWTLFRVLAYSLAFHSVSDVHSTQLNEIRREIFGVIFIRVSEMVKLRKSLKMTSITDDSEASDWSTYVN